MRGWPCVSTQKEEATKPQTSTDAKATRRTADAPPFGTLRNHAAAPATYLSMATWCSSTETLPQSQCVILSSSTTTLPGGLLRATAWAHGARDSSDSCRQVTSGAGKREEGARKQ